MQSIQSRRRFLTNLSLASAAAIVGAPKSLHAEPPPETTTVRLAKGVGAVCGAAEYVAQELLHAEGIADFRYVVPDWDKKFEKDTSEWIARGEIDFDWNFAPVSIRSIEAGVRQSSWSRLAPKFGTQFGARWCAKIRIGARVPETGTSTSQYSWPL
jgi:NitT/TauT family transport system substrate-binding protein